MKRAAERVIEIVREKWSERDKKQRTEAPEDDPFGADFVAFEEAEEGEVEVTAAPPWMARPHYASLDQELADFCAWVQPTRKERDLREETIARLNLLVAQTFGGADVSCHNFGSFHMGLALPGSRFFAAFSLWV
jgi:DNA polymerase sigma